MKAEKASDLAASIANIASHSPFERLRDESRYVILADLRMGDGGKKDELARSKKALFAILSKWYLPRDYTLVLNGDIEDLRRFWLKDIFAAWPEMYALFDAFKEKARLRKIVGDRDLALLRLRSYPYELSHGLRLDGEKNSIILLHGHQASHPYIGRDYLSDYMVHWLHTYKRPKAEETDADKQELFKSEKRLYGAACALGILAIQGHTRRPLFESRTNRDSIRAEVERLLRGSARRSCPSGLAYDDRSFSAPCMFSPGRALGARIKGFRALRMLEVKDGFISMVRWTSSRGGAASDEPTALEGTPYMRFERRSASIQGLFERMDLLGKA